MPNPDIGMHSSVISLAISVFVGGMIIVLFNYKSRISAFGIILWMGVPISVFILIFSANLAIQYSSCNDTNINKAAVGAIPSIFTTFIGLMVSSIAACRIPIASVFTPIIVGNKVDIKLTNTGNQCCNSSLTIHKVESSFSIIEGFAFGFYLMFSTFFGITLGKGYSSIC